MVCLPAGGGGAGGQARAFVAGVVVAAGGGARHAGVAEFGALLLAVTCVGERGSGGSGSALEDLGGIAFKVPVSWDRAARIQGDGTSGPGIPSTSVEKWVGEMNGSSKGAYRTSNPTQKIWRTFCFLLYRKRSHESGGDRPEWRSFSVLCDCSFQKSRFQSIFITITGISDRGHPFGKVEQFPK